MDWNIDICNDKDHSSRKGYSQTKMYGLAGGDWHGGNLAYGETDPIPQGPQWETIDLSLYRWSLCSEISIN